MKSKAILAVAGLGIGAGAPAAATTVVQLQVSPAGAEDWHSSVVAQPGDSVDIRVRVSFTGGPTTPLGLAEFICQPTVSHWRPGDDGMRTLVNNGLGSQNTTPIGAVADAPGQYGRIMPFAVTAFTSTSFLKGHVNAVGGVSYLRIAQAHITSWIGGAGNTTGGSGVNMRQYNMNGSGRDLFPTPAFNPALSNIVVFKFGVTLDADDPSDRTLNVDVPFDGIYRRAVRWFVTPDEVSPDLDDTPVIQTAVIHVPAPGITALLLLFAGAARRRRRR